ncbi:hypothetical protein [Sulfuricurvum sp.]|uniref:hypothetical protein n=1 Tax=Sulfuricurvum sp. TaxID=2025608 RepID=UPI002D71A4EE|nr:hypothetical protein [Sulfuricurvum sp.]HZF71243.1 hypothetical protein [Sulfuricurvum sp.]
MAHYENQSDMFKQRAENCKKNGDRLYAQAMEAKDHGSKDKYNEYMAQAQTQYMMQKENEAKAKEYAGKNWK